MPKYPEIEYEYKVDLDIDKHQLDSEWIGQPHKMMRYNEAHAQAQLDRDRAKQALDVTKANLDASIRAHLNESGVKFTEAVVDGKIKTSPTYLEAQTKLQEAEYRVNLIFGAVMAFQARKTALEELVRLHLSGYWSEPRVDASGFSKADVSQRSTEAAIMQEPPEPAPSQGAARMAPRPTPRPAAKRG